jgi:hypothetical protein
MILLLLVVAALMFLGVIFWGAIALFVHDDAKAKRLEADPVPILDQLFDGSLQVVYQPGTRWSLSTPTLIAGANAHGYRLVSDTGNMATRTVIFARA